MSKSSFKKFKKNDYWEDEEESNFANRSRYLEKRKHKLVERALKTKDISILADDQLDYIDDEDFYERK